MFSLRMSSSILVSLTCCLLFGCQTGQKDETATLRQENQALKATLADRDRQLQSSPDPAQLQAMQNEIAQREARIKELETQLRKPEASGPATPGIEGIQTSYDRKKGEMTVDLPADVLFDSGSANLKSSSKATLDKIVAALRKDYAGKKVRIEGHTDKDPIRRSGFTDNLELSQARAAAVTRYLIEKNVDRKLLATIGYGDTVPKATKAASRRVEIVVVVG